MHDFLEEPHIPYGLFRQDVKEYITYVTDMFGCPEDFVVAEAAIAMGTAIGKKVTMSHKSYEDMGNLWTCVIGAPGINKSAPAKFVLKPVIDYDKELFEGFLDERRSVEAENRNITAMNRTKEGKANPQSKKPLPKEKAVRLSDATPEKRNEMLANIDDSDLGLLCYYDELAQMFNQMGRYNKSAEVDELLSTFTGMSIKVSRKKEDTLMVTKPCLSIFGTIQPDRLQEYFGKPELMGSGFNQRWAFVWPMDAEIPHETEEDMPRDLIIESGWEGRVKDAFRESFTMIGNKIHWTQKARRRWYDWRERKIEEMKTLSECPYMQTVISKLDIILFHWILATHFLIKDFDENQVDEREMQQAIDTMEYFQHTAKNVYDKISEGRNSGLVTAVTPPTERMVTCYEKWKEGVSNNKNITQIAAELGVSRPYLSKCIKKCKEFDKKKSQSVTAVTT